MTDEKLIELAQEASAEWRDYDYWKECETCERSGRAYDIAGTPIQCPDCDGEGWIEL
jgi:hypothetical protein